MGLKAVANPAAGGQPGSFTTLTVSGAATIGGGLAVTGSISATNDVSLGVNAPLQFAAGLGTAPYLQHTANMLDVKQATSGLRVLNNAGTVALLAMTDGTTTQLSVTGSVSATGLVTANTLRVNVTPTAEVVVATHTAVFNINGTNYKFLCLAA